MVFVQINFKKCRRALQPKGQMCRIVVSFFCYIACSVGGGGWGVYVKFILTK